MLTLGATRSEWGHPIPNPSRAGFLHPRGAAPDFGHTRLQPHGASPVPAPACPQQGPAPSPAARGGHSQPRGATRADYPRSALDYLRGELGYRECPVLAAVSPWLWWPPGLGGHCLSPSLALPGAFCSSDSLMLPRKRWDSAQIRLKRAQTSRRDTGDRDSVVRAPQAPVSPSPAGGARTWITWDPTPVPPSQRKMGTKWVQENVVSHWCSRMDPSGAVAARDGHILWERGWELP